MRTDGQTDMTKLIVTFRSFANAPKNSSQDIRSLERDWRRVISTYLVLCIELLNSTIHRRSYIWSRWQMNKLWVCGSGGIMLKRESLSTQTENCTSANLSTTNPRYPQDCDFMRHMWRSFMFCCHKHSDAHIKHFVTAAKQFLLVARSPLWERHTTTRRTKDYRHKRWRYERKCRVQIIRLSEHRCCT